MRVHDAQRGEHTRWLTNTHARALPFSRGKKTAHKKGAQCQVDRRYKTVQYIAWLVGVSCQRTPFVYTHIMERARAERESHASAHRLSPSAVGAPPPCPCCNSDAVEAEPGSPPGVVCPRSDRAPFCIACLNWVRRLSKVWDPSEQPQPPPLESGGAIQPPPRAPQVASKKRGKSQRSIIPMDNLLIFMHNPGACSEPDKRTMFRLMQNACIEYTGPGSNVRIGNPYMCFSTHISSMALSVFKRKYFPSYQFDTRSKRHWR